MTGKTIARIESGPTDPEYGYARDDTLIVHFTDGTAMVVSGSSHEEVSLDWREADSTEVGRWTHAAQGRREADRLRRLKREEWLAITCEERAARREAKRAKMGTFERIMTDEMSAAYDDMLVGSSRMLFGDGQPRTIRRACRRCGDRECENASVETIPTVDPLRASFGATLTIPVAPSQKRGRARRS